jgi:hypothetical protein
MRAILACVFVVLSAGSAVALTQKNHAAISETACRNAGFGAAFCKRVADEAYNTDADEFEDLAAHAQPDDGMSACTAASRTTARLLDLGREARTALRDLRTRPSDRVLGAKAARALGRALHTVEDNCAHNGMPNPQHAWFSLNDACYFTSTSPDAAPAAYSCAQTEAAAIMGAMRRAADALGVDRAQLAADTVRRRWPRAIEACAFLALGDDWDGRDRRWNNQITVPAFRAQLADALTNDSSSLATICGAGQTLTRPAVNVDTSDGPNLLCAAVVGFCDGNDNADGEAEPPWETDDEDGPGFGEASGGCAAGATCGWLAIAGVAGVLRLRRREQPRPAARC